VQVAVTLLHVIVKLLQEAQLSPRDHAMRRVN